MKKLALSASAFATAVFSLHALAQSPAAAPVDPNAFLNQFESSFGKFEGFRRSGAKGICALGEFVGTAEARALPTASAFSGKPVPVVVRFSVGGANPKAPDNAKSQRNLALQFNLPNGELWQMGNISAPVFGASSPQQFFGRLRLRRDAILVALDQFTPATPSGERPARVLSEAEVAQGATRIKGRASRTWHDLSLY